MAKTKEIKAKKVAKKVTLGAVAEIKETKPKSTYAVEIESSGVSYKAKGDDLYQILLDFPAPDLLNTETNIKVTKGKKTIQKDLKVVDARRCFTGFETTSLELLAIGITKMLG